MYNEWNKCNFCKWNNDFECENICNGNDGFNPDGNKLIAKAKEKEITVADVIALIDRCG